MHSHLEQKFCLFVKPLEEMTNGKSIADYFFILLYHMKQTLPRFALIKEESPHFGSEKECEEQFRRKISRITNLVKFSKISSVLHFIPRHRSQQNSRCLTTAALDPALGEMDLHIFSLCC